MLADDGFERVRLKRLKDIAVELKVQHAAVEQHTAGERALVVKIGKFLGHLVGLFDLALREQRIAEIHHHRAVDECVSVFIYDGGYLLRVDHGADLIQCFAQHIEVFHGVFVAHRLPDGQLPVGALGVLCEELLTDLSYLFICLGLVKLIQKFVSCHDVYPLFIRNVFVLVFPEHAPIIRLNAGDYQHNRTVILQFHYIDETAAAVIPLPSVEHRAI